MSIAQACQRPTNGPWGPIQATGESSLLGTTRVALDALPASVLAMAGKAPRDAQEDPGSGVGPCPVCGGKSSAEFFRSTGRKSRVIVKWLRVRCTEGCGLVIEHENHAALKALWNREAEIAGTALNREPRAA